MAVTTSVVHKTNAITLVSFAVSLSDRHCQTIIYVGISYFRPTDLYGKFISVIALAAGVRVRHTDWHCADVRAGENEGNSLHVRYMYASGSSCGIP